MIQFNLLPDVKLEYIRARRNKRLTILIASAVAGASLAILIVLFLVVNVYQKDYLKELSDKIETDSNTLKQTEDINDILTVQSQLRSLPALHSGKPVASRLFGYIQDITPGEVSVAKMDINFETSTINISGAAPSLSSIYKFIDTMKFAGYRSDTSAGSAFSNVVLSNSGRDTKGASYVIDLTFDPAIFQSASDISLVIPDNFVTTRSEVKTPLFEPLSNPEDLEEGEQ